PTRRMGVLSSSSRRTDSSLSTISSAEVSTPPTSIALTRILGANSGAASRVMNDSPAFAVPYAVKPGCTMLPARDEMLTIAPRSVSLKRSRITRRRSRSRSPGRETDGATHSGATDAAVPAGVLREVLLVVALGVEELGRRAQLGRDVAVPGLLQPLRVLV